MIKITLTQGKITENHIKIHHQDLKVYHGIKITKCGKPKYAPEIQDNI